MHEIDVLGFLPVEANAFYVMDRGYLDFVRLFRQHQAGAFFATRDERDMKPHGVYSVTTDRSMGVTCDRSIALNSFYAARGYPERMRRIRFKDLESGKTSPARQMGVTRKRMTLEAG